MKLLVAAFFLPAWLAAGVCGAEPLDLKVDQGKLGYSIGYLMGADFLSQNRELNPDLLLKGIADAQSGKTTLLTAEQMKRTLTRLQKETARAQAQVQADAARENKP